MQSGVSDECEIELPTRKGVSNNILSPWNMLDVEVDSGVEYQICRMKK
jgi:hypothetical protein